MLDLNEVDQHPHNASRNSFIKKDGIVLPVPAPKLSITPGVLNKNNPFPLYGHNTTEVLQSIGYSQNEINELMLKKVVFEEVKTKI